MALILPNVNDEVFLNDRLLLTDLIPIVNGVTAVGQDLRRDLSGARAFIRRGLFLQLGTAANTFQVTAGSGEDNDGQPVALAVPSDDSPVMPDTGGGMNYLALKHAWAYTDYQKAFFTQEEYYRRRTDSYTVHVAATEQLEADGFIRIARVSKVEGVWQADYSYRSADGYLFPETLTLPIPHLDLTNAPTLVPGQWRTSPFTWLGRVVRVVLADDYQAVEPPLAAFPVDLDGILHIAAYDTTYWLGSIENGGHTDVVPVGLKVLSTAPHQIYLLLGLTTTAIVCGKVELLGLYPGVVSEPV